MRVDVATEAFGVHRDLLYLVVHELLGSAADAEDVLQETWLRWVHTDVGRVDDRRAALVRIAVGQALARLQEDGEPGGLGGTGRDGWRPAAVISAYVDVDAAAPRSAPIGEPDGTWAALEQVRSAIETSDPGGLDGVLADAAVAVVDGGGAERGAIRPVVGAAAVARLVSTLAAGSLEVATHPVRVDGHPALVVESDGMIRGVVALVVDGATVTGVYHARTPEAVRADLANEPTGTVGRQSADHSKGNDVRFIQADDFRADRAWGALDIAEIDPATVRLHWTDEPYRWHVNDGPEVFVVLDGVVDMHYRADGAEHVERLEPGRICLAEVGDEHVAHPVGAARILVVERAGSV